MLTTKRLAGVTPKVSLRNLSCVGNEARKGTHPGFEIHGRLDQKSKTAVSVAASKNYYPSKHFKIERTVLS